MRTSDALFVAEVKAMSSEMQTKGYSNISQVNKLKNAFISFNMGHLLSGQSFNSLRTHLLDYNKILSAYVSSIKTDIEDCKGLKNGIGDEDLDGSIIVPAKIFHEQKKNYYENLVAQYEPLEAAWNDLDGPNPYSVPLSLYRANVEFHTEYFNLYKEKCETYDKIQSTTMNLFKQGQSARSQLDTALSQLAGDWNNGQCIINQSAPFRMMDFSVFLTYKEYVVYRAENATDDTTRRVYEKYLKYLNVTDRYFLGTPRFNHKYDDIKLNQNDDKYNIRGEGCTYFHEFGHMVDNHSKRGESNYSSVKNKEFYQALKDDFDNYVNQIMVKNGYTTKQQAYTDISNQLKVDPNMKNGLSDIVNGLSGGQCSGNWSHSKDYYTDQSIPKEAFAHFFEASMYIDSTKIDYLIEMFPNAYKEYQEMLEDML